MQAVISDDLRRFMDRVSERRRKFETLVQWHTEVHLETGLELPYNGDEQYISVQVYEWDDENSKYLVNSEKSLTNLATIAQYAIKKGLKVTKSYDSSFNLDFEIPFGDSTLRMNYYASRDSVCTKKVVGYEDVPEQVIPATKKEIVEWDCQPVSLLAIPTKDN